MDISTLNQQKVVFVLEPLNPSRIPLKDKVLCSAPPLAISKRSQTTFSTWHLCEAVCARNKIQNLFILLVFISSLFFWILAFIWGHNYVVLG